VILPVCLRERSSTFNTFVAKPQPFAHKTEAILCNKGEAMAKIDNDDVSNNSGNPSFQEIVEARLSRRGFLGGGLAAAAAFSFSGVNALLRSVPASAQDIGQGSLRPLLGFQGVPVSDADTVVVPPGYSARVLVAWGVPVSNGPEFKQDGRNSAADQAQQWGCTMTAWCTSQSRIGAWAARPKQ
jgi:hypothetical protein